MDALVYVDEPATADLWATALIQYMDTRASLSGMLPFTEVVLRGLAPGGGLFVPERLPNLSQSDLAELSSLPYWGRVARVFDRFELGIPTKRVAALAKAA